MPSMNPQNHIRVFPLTGYGERRAIDTRFPDPVPDERSTGEYKGVGRPGELVTC